MTASSCTGGAACYAANAQRPRGTRSTRLLAFDASFGFDRRVAAAVSPPSEHSLGACCSPSPPASTTPSGCAAAPPVARPAVLRRPSLLVQTVTSTTAVARHVQPSGRGREAPRRKGLTPTSRRSTCSSVSRDGQHQTVLAVVGSAEAELGEDPLGCTYDAALSNSRA